MTSTSESTSAWSALIHGRALCWNTMGNPRTHSAACWHRSGAHVTVNPCLGYSRIAPSPRVAMAHPFGPSPRLGGDPGIAQRVSPPGEVVEHGVDGRGDRRGDVADRCVAAEGVHLEQVAAADVSAELRGHHLQFDTDSAQVLDRTRTADAAVAEGRERLADPLAVGLV